MNQNQFIFDGIKYRSNAKGNTSCSTCALFPDPMNCATMERPSCNGNKRTDGLNVNFKKVKK